MALILFRWKYCGLFYQSERKELPHRVKKCSDHVDSMPCHFIWADPYDLTYESRRNNLLGHLYQLPQVQAYLQPSERSNHHHLRSESYLRK